MYFKIPVNQKGDPDVNFDFVKFIGYINNECYVKLRPGFTQKATWVELTQAEWDALNIEESTEIKTNPSAGEKLKDIEEQQLNLMAGLADLYELLMSK